jgi:hypothetical protein
MNRKIQRFTVEGPHRGAARRLCGSFFNLGSALTLSNQFAEAAYRKAVRITPHAAFWVQKIGS